jgi:Domain of unknown function (DUF4333)
VLGSPGPAEEEATTAMTTPRQPYGPDDRGRAGWDAPDRDEGDDDATWGRPPTGGWGAADPGYGAAGPGTDRPRYGEPRYGAYGEPGYGAQQGRSSAYEPVGGSGAGAAASYDDRHGDDRYEDDRYGDDRHRDDRHGDDRDRDGRYGDPTRERYQPSWGQGPAVTPRRAARRPQRPPWVVLGAAGLVVAAFLVLGFVTPGWFVTRVLDAAAVQTGVAKILTDNYGVDGVADVHCPGGVRVTPGATFTCDATIDGDPVKVPIRITDGKGGYEVGRPT